jgi:hypothetical protein
LRKPLLGDAETARLVPPNGPGTPIGPWRCAPRLGWRFP